MTSRGRVRYGLRFRDGLVPTVEVTIPTVKAYDPLNHRVTATHHEVVATRRGFTQAQALKRATRWARKHGDPR